MNDASDDRSSIDCERDLIEAGRREAAELGKSPGLPKPSPIAVPGYEIIREIGRGGMGEVYEAQQQHPRRRVALKVLRRLPPDEQQLKLFEQEIQVLADLNHPAITTIYEAGRTKDGQHFFAMELVAGERVDAYVRRKNVPRRQLLDLFHRVCEAVHFAHQHDVIHRDLKPSNILIDAEGNPKILDFGLARFTHAEAAADSRQIMGTLGYMSPEQARPPTRIDPRSDVYSLGIILHKLLTDEPPDQRPDARQGRALRGDIKRIVLTASEEEPAERYQSAKELADDIRRYLKGEPIGPRRSSPIYVIRKKLWKHWRGVALAAAAAALVLIGLRHQAQGLYEARRSVLRIQVLLATGEVERALGEASFLLEQRPGLTEARIVAAMANLEKDSRGYAIDVLKPGRRPGRWKWLLDELIEAITHSTGVVALGKDLPTQTCADRDDPRDSAEAWYLRSFATNDRQWALQCAQRAAKRDPAHTLVWWRLRDLGMLTEKPDIALRAVEKLMDLGEDSIECTVLKGTILARQGDLQAALRCLDEAAKARPTRSDTYIYRAKIRLLRKEYKKALKDYNRGIEIEEPSAWTYYHRATVLWMSGKAGDAEEDYRKFQERIASHYYAHARQFFILHELRSPHDAKKVLAEAREKVPDGSWLAKILACLAGELTPTELVQEANRNDREQLCEAYYYAGERCRLNGQDSEARQWFQRCVDTGLVLDPNSFPLDPMNEYHLAVWWLDNLPAENSAASRPQPE